MPEQLCFVQFPHPGVEHAPKTSPMAWNRAAHGRKFIRATGRYVQGGAVRQGGFTLWGEWEPPSRIVRRFVRPVAGMPRVLHEPSAPVPPDGAWRQNTDPLVFGSRMIYSNCRQQQNRKLRELAPGSVILFGSKLHGEFVLDTVFVVTDAAAFTVGSSEPEDWAPDEWLTVVEPLALDGAIVGRGFRRYESRPPASVEAQPFSYVPCLPWQEDGAPFRRPTIRLDARWLNPRLSQNARVTPASLSELQGLWDDVTRQVEDQGLCLAVSVAFPA